MTYQTMKEWYELGDKTEFAVSGCYGDYIKMLMTLSLIHILASKAS